MRLDLRSLGTAVIASAALLFVQVAPVPLDLFGSEPVFAKSKGGEGGGRKSGSRGGSESSSKSSSSKGGGKGGSKSSSSSRSANATAKNPKTTRTSVASSKKTVAPASAGSPKAVVRQYALESGLKQGDVASLLKSWNSLNRNEQAYLNNMDNLQSLPGKQLAYIRGSIAVDTALTAFTALGGDPAAPPSETEVLAAQGTIDQWNQFGDEWTAYQAAIAANDTALQDGLLAATPELATLPADFDTQFAAAETLIAQNEAWTTYQAAETAANDAFLAASVSYGAGTDQATLDELRTTVDEIITLKGLDTLVSDFDSAAAPEPETTPAE